MSISKRKLMLPLTAAAGGLTLGGLTFFAGYEKGRIDGRAERADGPALVRNAEATDGPPFVHKADGLDLRERMPSEQEIRQRIPEFMMPDIENESVVQYNISSDPRPFGPAGWREMRDLRVQVVPHGEKENKVVALQKKNNKTGERFTVISGTWLETMEEKGDTRKYRVGRTDPKDEQEIIKAVQTLGFEGKVHFWFEKPQK